MAFCLGMVNIGIDVGGCDSGDRFVEPDKEELDVAGIMNVG
jgi:hypothetical protein